MRSRFGFPTLPKISVNSSRKDAGHHKSSLEDPHSETASLIGLYASSRDPSLFTEPHECLNMIFDPKYNYTEFEIPQKTSATAQNQDLVAIFTSASNVPSGSPSGYSPDDVDSFICMEEDRVTTEAEVERRPVGDAPDSEVSVPTKRSSFVDKFRRRNSYKVTNSGASRRSTVYADTASVNFVAGGSSSVVGKEKVKSSSASIFNMGTTSPNHCIAEPLASSPFPNTVSEPKGKKTFFKPLRRSTLPAPNTYKSREHLLD